MSAFIIAAGWGAVSPAGWSAADLSNAVRTGSASAVEALPRPGWERSHRIRKVPKPVAKLPFLAHPRLRRTSPVSQFAVSAALEALGNDRQAVEQGALRLGVVFCVMSGCVNYSRRFYDEVLKDPGTASPLVFPETVFNAPGSHLASLLGATGINYTLVGDPGMFLQGLALAAKWLERGLVDSCLVVSAEESDWLTAEASALFSAEVVLSEGAGAIYLKQGGPGKVSLDAITDSFSFRQAAEKHTAAAAMQRELSGTGSTALLCDSVCGDAVIDSAEVAAWQGDAAARMSLKPLLGEAFAAASAWQCVLACEEIANDRSASAFVSVVGCNQQAIGARWGKA